MVIEILLIISIILQLSAASVAIGLIRKTKYNLSWMLFTVGLTVMAFLRFGEYIQRTGSRSLSLPPEFFVWMGIITSLCFAVGVFLVQKIFKYISLVESQRRVSEKRILHTILRTEEKERKRFSKDMHDGLGPLLSSAKMSISAIDKTVLSDRDREIIHNTDYVINEAIRSIREIATNLSPHVLNDFGLVKALVGFIKRLPQEGVEITLSTEIKNERFDTDIELILYRVICELINNSLKHSEAKHIVVSLGIRGTAVRVDYTDDGCGFDPNCNENEGMGIANMRSRISSLKGGLMIKTAPGEGVHALINIPITQ